MFLNRSGKQLSVSRRIFALAGKMLFVTIFKELQREPVVQ